MERADASEARLALIVFAVVTVALFVGVYLHMQRSMRPPTDVRARGGAADRSGAESAQQKEPERPSVGRVGTIGAGLLGTMLAASCAYIIIRSGTPLYPILVPVAGFVVGHVLVYATTRSRTFRKPFSALWAMVSVVGLLLLLYAVPPGKLFALDAGEARVWALPILALLVALGVSSVTRLSTLWQSGRWREF